MQNEIENKRVETLTGVPAERVKYVVESFRRDGAVKVEFWKESRRRAIYTVRVVFAAE